MSGKRPKYTRTPDGGLLGISCYEICRFWAEEDEFEGRNADAQIWRDEADNYKRGIEYGMSWSHNPFIEKRLKAEENKWKGSYVPWDQWHLYEEAGY